MLYTKTIDVCIIGNALLGEVCAQICTVGSDGKGKLLQSELMLKIELICHRWLRDDVYTWSYGVPDSKLSGTCNHHHP